MARALTAVLVVLSATLQVYAQACCATLTPAPIALPGVPTDTLDYVYGAVGLLHGRYIAEWNANPHVPQYPPGFSLLLLPAVAVGGVEAAVWVTYAAVVVSGIATALIANQVLRPAAAAPALVAVLFTPAFLRYGHLIMTEVPSTALALAEVAILVRGRRPVAAAAAGAIGGALVWLRPATGVLILAGLAGATARRPRLRWIGLYLVGAVPFLVALALLQLVMFGSPLTTGYQAVGHPTERPRGPDIGEYFNRQWVFGPPEVYDSAGLGGRGTTWRLRNLEMYPLQLLGADAFVTWPGVGAVGLIALLRLAVRNGTAGILGRFSVLAVLGTMAVYIPYWYQSGRFLIVPASLANLAAGLLVAEMALSLANSWKRDPRWRTIRARLLGG